jgi:hypothetical protein
VLVEVGAESGTDGIEDEVGAFAAREFGSGHAIIVAGDEDDLIGI